MVYPLSVFDSYLTSLNEYQALSNSVDKGRLPMGINGVSHIHKAHIISALCKEKNRRGLIITSDEAEAVRFCEDLSNFGMRSVLFPARDLNFRSTESYSRQFEHARLGALSKISDEDYDIAVCSVDSACQYTISPEKLLKRTFTFNVGKELPPDILCKLLISSGYIHSELVEGIGQFARRGGIIDIFLPQTKDPIRIEYFGDEIDSISYFDVITQRRTDSLNSITVPPVHEVLFDTTDILADRLNTLVSNLKPKSNEKAKENLNKDIEVAKNGIFPDGIDRFIPLLEEQSTIFDYTADAILFVSESVKVKEKHRVYKLQQEKDIEILFDDGVLCKGLDDFSVDFTTLSNIYIENEAIFLDNFARGGFDVPVKELVTFTASTSTPWTGNLSVLCDDISPLISKGYTVVLASGSEKTSKIFYDDLNKLKIPCQIVTNNGEVANGIVNIIPNHFSAGFEYISSKFCLITHGKLSSYGKKKTKTDNKNSYHSLDELKVGDYVVHSVHGIGIFNGINKIQSSGVTKDYITISYAGKDVLYIPVTQLDLVSKYIGPSGECAVVRLNKIGGSEWTKTKTKVRGMVKDIAKELIELYSKRIKTPGHAFCEDTDFQNDFERRFEYEETEDQLRCINEIKKDMERPIPMDRLLCGDVGFGKTEVALRAAFKCIADGKQCAMLVPTTILAWQHYQTVLKRMDNMPVEIDLLSRFRTKSQQDKTIRRLKTGESDMVIGTHRLISKDVSFKNLGLVIIDEEQRFGVAQKEKLKEKFPNVDILTLSATPIPRTLNMAMSGIRDMSIIEEAPLDRHPVQTYVTEYDAGLIAEAIRRELRRGGQIYYLHNRVDNIEKVAASLKLRIPEARVGIAHGQMGEEELSEVWRKLIENEIDLLVCTTIIETGVDVPNANTLIVENADCFGLAQLHQIRGRIGRSSRRAYAYLTFRRGKILNEDATKRLEAIREFAEFGSGLKIAMRDLEIRGAGNLLGGEQHGQMASVGYDMYLKLLEQAVKEEKGEKVEETPECMVDIQIEAHIPEWYISNLSQRIGVYRTIADIKTDEDVYDVTDELIDRFGQPPSSVMGLIKVALLRNRAANLGIYEAVQRGDSMLLYHNSPDIQKVMSLSNKMRGRIRLNAGNKPHIVVKLLKSQEPLFALNEVLTHLEKDE